MTVQNITVHFQLSLQILYKERSFCTVPETDFNRKCYLWFETYFSPSIPTGKWKKEKKFCDLGQTKSFQMHERQRVG